MKELFERSAYLQALWDVASEMYLVLDRDGTILDRNPLADKLLPVSKVNSLAEAIAEPDALRQALEESAIQNRPVSIQPLTVSLAAEASLEITLRVTPIREVQRSAGVDASPPERFLACLARKSNELDILEETARLNDERVERLRERLTLVSRELVDRTLQLAEQKNKILTIINGMGDGLIGCDDKGRMIQYNDTARKLLSLPEGDLTQKALSGVCPELAEALRLDSFPLARRTQEELNFPYRNKEIRVGVSPIFDDRRHAVGLVLILQDRTKQAEVDRMKSDLISIVSHELRSPLTSIKGYIDLMISGDLGEVNDSMRSYLSIISSNANRLAALIDDMLDLSRIESGKLTMTFGKVDVKYLCDYVYLTIRPQAEQKKLRFNLEVQSRAVVSGDIDRLQQALTNLVSNAIKYTPVGGSVTIRAAGQGGNIHISVQDTGFGISEENLKRLFQKFFRVKNEQTRNIGGTGLGLCIAKSIVEAHEGQILVETREGTGSTFTIVLPEYHS